MEVKKFEKKGGEEGGFLPWLLSGRTEMKGSGGGGGGTVVSPPNW
jgi:hypothetical protein